MLKLFRRQPPATTPKGSVPPGQRVYAIGDIHGRLDLLDALLALIEADDAKRPQADVQLIFVGDLIDRGPESAGVVDRVMAIKAHLPATRILMGNHEEVFLKALAGDERALKFFCKIGGRETILSYGVTLQQYQEMDYAHLLAELQQRVPPAHRSFVESFEDMVVIGDYAFVHAGLRPGIALDSQKASDLRWIRQPFLDHAPAFERIIVHGHSITEDVEFRSNRIGIDTGAFASGKLTALALEESNSWIITTR